MYRIQLIQKMFNVSATTARMIIDRMVLDFSECTKEQFEREAKFVWEHCFT